MQLKSANNALEFAITQKDDLIIELKDKLANAPKEEKTAKGEDGLDRDERLAKLSVVNKRLETRVDELNEKNIALEDELASLRIQMKHDDYEASKVPVGRSNQAEELHALKEETK
mmetsp:Transcript_5802/g.9266  ORF Transcript_5802/g.9266 Transcript_5802/m.9266 type:complete len:115 (+) Transcript_5802:2041-2385(+)